MTGDELKQLRADLGEAIGRRLSDSDMAALIGLADPKRNGKDTYRKWEDGAGPSGPVTTLLSLFRLACNSELPSPDMLRGAAMACQRFGIDFRGGVPAQNIFREMMREEIRRRLR
jgi:hypothetical protein